jgi:hypothetical protein
LESLGRDVRPMADYHFGFWWDYVTFCRDAAGRYGVTMRTLDRALWLAWDKRQR